MLVLLVEHLHSSKYGSGMPRWKRIMRTIIGPELPNGILYRIDKNGRHRIGRPPDKHSFLKRMGGLYSDIVQEKYPRNR